MALALSNLKSFKQKVCRRVGRGDGSGRGTYSGRGLKGQKSRTGGRKKLKRKGLKQFLHQIPKSRGFKSMYPSFKPINVRELNAKFDNGEVITLNKILKAGLIKTKADGVKILGHGKLDKKFTVQAYNFSKSAENAIKKAGGKIELIK